MLALFGKSLRTTVDKRGVKSVAPGIWKSSPCVALCPNGELRVLIKTWAVNVCSDTRLLLMSVSNLRNSSGWKIVRCVKPISIAVDRRERRKQLSTQEMLNTYWFEHIATVFKTYFKVQKHFFDTEWEGRKETQSTIGNVNYCGVKSTVYTNMDGIL